MDTLWTNPKPAPSSMRGIFTLLKDDPCDLRRKDTEDHKKISSKKKSPKKAYLVMFNTAAKVKVKKSTK